MKNFTYLVTTFISSIFLFSCNENEKKYEARLQELENRENELLSREKIFSAKNAEYEILKSKFDSINKTKDDLLSVFPENFLGYFRANMICESAACSGHSVGDIRNENWEFSTDNGNVVVKAFDTKGNFIRIYSGKYFDNNLNLLYKNESDNKTQNVTMEVKIDNFQENKMKGTRKLLQENCEVLYSLELTKN